MTRSMLEKALIHLLNEEQEQAERILHAFMVKKARQIHESLRTGDEAVLKEGWDDEIATEEYFGESDLADAEDEPGVAAGDEFAEPGAEGDDLDAADASAGLSDDLGDETGDDLGDETGDEMGDEMGDDLGGEPVEGEGLESDVADIKDQLEKLTAEFEQMMASLDVDGDGDHDEDDHALQDADASEEDAEGEADGFGADEDAEGEAEDADETAEDADAADEGEDAGADEGEDDYDDITESVLAELEKVSVTMADGKEVADGKSITTNKTSPIPQKGLDARAGAKPVFTKAKEHHGFERETAPPVKQVKARKNTRSSAEQGNAPVKAPAARKEGSQTDLSTAKVEPKSPLAPNAKSVR